MSDITKPFKIHLAIRIPVIVYSLLIVLANEFNLYWWFTGEWEEYEYGLFAYMAICIGAFSGIVLLGGLILLCIGVVEWAGRLYLVSTVFYFPAILISAADEHYDWRVWLFFGGSVLLMRFLITRRISLFLDVCFAFGKTGFVLPLTRKLRMLLEPNYPPLIYGLGFVNIAVGLFFVFMGVYGIGAIIIVLCAILLLVHRKLVYLGFCLIYCIITAIVGYNVFLNGFDQFFLGFLFRIILLVGVIGYYPYLFGAKVHIGTSERLLKKAMKAEIKGDYMNAFDIYNKLISDFPDTTAAKDAQQSIEVLRKEGRCD